MRVLHFVSVLSRGSGVMSVIMNYYRHIDRERVQFDFLFFLPCQDSYAGEIESLGGRVTLIPRPGLTGGAAREIAGFLREHGGEYTWLHNHEVYLSFLLEPLAKKYGIPGFIVHSHTTKYSDRPLGALRNRILCLPIRFMRSRQGFRMERFACSEAAGRFLYGKRRMEKGQVFILRNAIDRDRFRFDPDKRRRVREELGLEGKFVIGHVGRFERQKNHEFLVKVFAECKKHRDESVLMLVGDGSLRPKIEAQVKELGLEASVLFLGQRDDVADLYQAMDVFVLPSLYEGLPVSCLEAQACALPCSVSKAITHEIDYSFRIRFLSLRKTPFEWALVCLKSDFSKREETSIWQKGWDIGKETIKLEAFYGYKEI